MSLSKGKFRFVVCFVLIAVLCSMYMHNVFAKDGSKEIEILHVLNRMEDESLTRIETLVKMNFENGEIVEIGKAFSVYNADEEDMFYLYPIYVNSECVFIAESGKDGNVVLSNNVEIINTIEALDTGKYILYVSDGKYYAQSLYQNKLLQIACVINVENSTEFVNLTFEQKEEWLKTLYGGTEIYFEDASSSEIIKIVDTYTAPKTRSVISGYENGKYTYRCNITNFVSQGNYGLCWSATAATIVNYKKGTSLNAMYFADRYHIGYDEGASLEQTNICFQSYGLSYTLSNFRIGWSQIKSNINNDKPFVIRLYQSINNSGGHQITGYGYGCEIRDSIASYRTIYAWDPNGYKISFLDSDSIISTSGYSFVWNRSLY